MLKFIHWRWMSRSTYPGRIAAVCALVVGSCAYAVAAEAAVHTVAPNTANVDCTSYDGGVRAGDTIVLAGQSRGSVKFSKCVGTASNPITIRNDTSLSGPLMVNQSGNGFQTQCTDCNYVVIDGTGKWAGAPGGECGATIDNGEWRVGKSQCGIVLKCVSGSPQSALRLSGSSKNITVKGVEVDGGMPACRTTIGISVNDHNYTPKPGEWREGIRALNNYVHDVEGEGIYIGPNQTNHSLGDMQLRDNEIGNNVVDRTGCDGINYKSAIAGLSSIHHNFVTNTGQSPRGKDSGCSSVGIALFEAGFTEIHSNYIEAPSPVSSGAGHCISQIVSKLSSSKVATLPVKIYNNVVRNCKGNGISLARGSTGVAAPVVSVYNNTVVAPIGGKGISVSTSIPSCSVRDNIVAGKTVVANNCSVGNNSTNSVEFQKFLDPSGRDFRLTAGSPAVDVGSNDCPDFDLVGIARPQQGVCDQGAFEFTNSATASTKPNPPEQVFVE